VIVNSIPAQVTIAINGQAVGSTDSNGYFLIESLKPGAYTVSASKAGYQLEKTIVKLAAGQTETLNFELRPITQALSVSSTPPECEVFIDDVLRGNTGAGGKLRIPDLPVGDHKIILRKPRFHEAEFPLALNPDKEGEINAKLDWAVGFLTVKANVPNARIEVAGPVNYDGAVENLECPTGTYFVRASSPLYESLSKQVVVTGGEASNVPLELRPDLSARNRLLAEAQESYSQRDYGNAIEAAGKLVAVDPTDATTLTILGQSYFMRNDFNAFEEYASRAIDAGGSIEVQLRHHHSFWGASSMHFIRLVLTAQTISFDPQAQEISEGICPNPPFSVNLQSLAAADVSGNRENEVYLKLVFAEPNNPKKTATLKFADRESSFVHGTKTKSAGGIIGFSYEADIMVSRPEAINAMSAIAEVIHRIKANAATALTARTDVPDVVLEDLHDSNGPSALPSLESIIDTNIKAAGRPANWTSMVQRGTYTWTNVATGQSIAGTFEESVKGRDKYSHVFSNEGIGPFLTEGYDGSTAWYKLYKKKPQPLNSVQITGIKRELILGALTNGSEFREVFPEAQIKGKGKLGEREVYIIEANTSDERLYTFYFDTQTGLVLRRDSRYEDPDKKGSTISTKVTYDDYVDVDGRKVATTWKQVSPSVILTVKISDTKYGVPIDDAIFGMPRK